MVCLFLDDRNKCSLDDRFQIAKMLNMHETIVEGVICCWNKMKLKSVVCRGFQHDKSLPRFLFMLRIYILWWIVKQKSTSYRVNEMFLSCTSFMKMSICCWFYKTISPDMILCIKECNKKCQHIFYIKISITLFGKYF